MALSMDRVRSFWGWGNEGAGLGADILLSPDHGLLLGTRAGYIARSANDDESVAYFVVAFGAGARHHPPTVVARQ